jgi:hypothetical protein
MPIQGVLTPLGHNLLIPWGIIIKVKTVICNLGIMISLEIVKGNDRPGELGAPEYSGHGKTAGLMLQC